MGETERPRILILVRVTFPGSTSTAEKWKKPAEKLPGSYLFVTSLNKVNLSEWDAIISLTGQVPEDSMRHLRGFCDNYDPQDELAERCRGTVAGRQVVLPDFTVNELAADLEEVIKPFLEQQAKSESKEAFLKLPEQVDGKRAPEETLVNMTPILRLPSDETIAMSMALETFPSNEWIVVAGHTGNPFEWFEACLVRWNRSDPAAFPLDTWRESEAWMTANETQALANLTQIERKRMLAIDELDRELEDAQQRLETLSSAAINSERRLLTATGDQLVEAVKDAFERLGFQVEDQDAIAEVEERERLEDLRVTLNDSSSWIALAEVKSRKRPTSGNEVIASFMRPLARYTKLHQTNPDALWFIANSQLGVDPSSRFDPLHSSPDDLAAFAEDSGLVISSVDLFRLLRALDLGQISPEDARALFIGKTGLMILPDGIE